MPGGSGGCLYAPRRTVYGRRMEPSGPSFPLVFRNNYDMGVDGQICTGDTDWYRLVQVIRTDSSVAGSTSWSREPDMPSCRNRAQNGASVPRCPGGGRWTRLSHIWTTAVPLDILCICCIVFQRKYINFALKFVYWDKKMHDNRLIGCHVAV